MSLWTLQVDDQEGSNDWAKLDSALSESFLFCHLDELKSRGKSLIRALYHVFFFKENDGVYQSSKDNIRGRSHRFLEAFAVGPKNAWTCLQILLISSRSSQAFALMLTEFDPELSRHLNELKLISSENLAFGSFGKTLIVFACQSLDRIVRGKAFSRASEDGVKSLSRCLICILRMFFDSSLGRSPFNKTVLSYMNLALATLFIKFPILCPPESILENLSLELNVNSVHGSTLFKDILRALAERIHDSCLVAPAIVRSNCLSALSKQGGDVVEFLTRDCNHSVQSCNVVELTSSVKTLSEWIESSLIDITFLDNLTVLGVVLNVLLDASRTLIANTDGEALAIGFISSTCQLVRVICQFATDGPSSNSSSLKPGKVDIECERSDFWSKSAHESLSSILLDTAPVSLEKACEAFSSFTSLTENSNSEIDIMPVFCNLINGMVSVFSFALLYQEKNVKRCLEESSSWSPESRFIVVPSMASESVIRMSTHPSMEVAGLLFEYWSRLYEHYKVLLKLQMEAHLRNLSSHLCFSLASYHMNSLERGIWGIIHGVAKYPKEHVYCSEWSMEQREAFRCTRRDFRELLREVIVHDGALRPLVSETKHVQSNSSVSVCESPAKRLLSSISTNVVAWKDAALLSLGRSDDLVELPFRDVESQLHALSAILRGVKIDEWGYEDDIKRIVDSLYIIICSAASRRDANGRGRLHVHRALLRTVSILIGVLATCRIESLDFQKTVAQLFNISLALLYVPEENDLYPFRENQDHIGAVAFAKLCASPSIMKLYFTVEKDSFEGLNADELTVHAASIFVSHARSILEERSGNHRTDPFVDLRYLLDAKPQALCSRSVEILLQGICCFSFALCISKRDNFSIEGLETILLMLFREEFQWIEENLDCCHPRASNCHICSYAIEKYCTALKHFSVALAVGRRVFVDGSAPSCGTTLAECLCKCFEKPISAAMRFFSLNTLNSFCNFDFREGNLIDYLLDRTTQFFSVLLKIYDSLPGEIHIGQLLIIVRECLSHMADDICRANNAQNALTIWEKVLTKHLLALLQNFVRDIRPGSHRAIFEEVLGCISCVSDIFARVIQLVSSSDLISQTSSEVVNVLELFLAILQTWCSTSIKSDNFNQAISGDLLKGDAFVVENILQSALVAVVTCQDRLFVSSSLCSDEVCMAILNFELELSGSFKGRIGDMGSAGCSVDWWGQSRYKILLKMGGMLVSAILKSIDTMPTWTIDKLSIMAYSLASQFPDRAEFWFTGAFKAINQTGVSTMNLSVNGMHHSPFLSDIQRQFLMELNQSRINLSIVKKMLKSQSRGKKTKLSRQPPQKINKRDSEHYMIKC